MASAVFIKDPHSGEFYRRSIWYHESRNADAIAAKESWLKDCPDCEAMLVENSKEQGE